MVIIVKKIFIIIGIILLIALVFYLIPYIKIDKNNKIMYLSYTDILSEYDEVTCYDDGMAYYKEKDITIKRIDIEKKFIFYLVTLDYVEGNLCDKEFYLEENYIDNFIKNAEIKENPKNVNLKNLIKGKNPIVGNTRYFGNDYETFISYILDDKHEILYVFYKGDMLIIQVGLSDEGPKFIAYK